MVVFQGDVAIFSAGNVLVILNSPSERRIRPVPFLHRLVAFPSP